VLIVLSPYVLATGGSCSTAEILQLQSTGNDPGPVQQYNYFVDGIQAAFQQNSPNVTIHVADFFHLPYAGPFLDECLTKYPNSVAIVGLMGNPLQTEATTGIPVAEGYVSIGTAFYGDSFSVWTPTSYVTRTEEVIELAMLLRYCINVMRIARLAAFVSTQSNNGETRQENFLKYYLNAAGYVNGTDWFPVLYEVGLTEFEDLNPQGVVCTTFYIPTIEAIRDSVDLADLAYFTASYRYGRLIQVVGNVLRVYSFQLQPASL